MFVVGPEERSLSCVSAAAALGLTALGAILFLRTDEAQTASMFPDNAGAFDALLETTEQLIERLGIFNLYPHA